LARPRFLSEELWQTGPIQWIDALHDSEAAAKLRAFQKFLPGRKHCEINTLENLVQEVMATVYKEDLKTRKSR
jgi:hypothetical protein